MRKLLNTLYITQEDAYVGLDGENIVVSSSGEEKFRIPISNIEGIVCFNYMGCSPAVMGKCADNGISLSFLKPSGRFLARVSGSIKGNVHLRRMQYEMISNDEICIKLTQNVLASKLHNSRFILNRLERDHKDKINEAIVVNAIAKLTDNIELLYNSNSMDSLRGIEGESAQIYYSVFNELIITNKDSFKFERRTKRPPLDKVNAMLSYLYTILSLDVQSALETVGLDPYIGFFHTDRSGRASLALDLVEELRAYIVDRLVVSMINLQQVKEDEFLVKEGGGVIMTEECRKKILKQWQLKKTQIITHSVINEKIQLGLLPYVQAKLLAKYIRKEEMAYYPFLCR